MADLFGQDHVEGGNRFLITDVLQAFDVRSREVLWEFSADKSPRAFAATRAGAAFIISDDTVVVFR